MNYFTKKDFLKLGSRSNVHTEIRGDLYLQFSILSKQLNEPLTKLFDLAIIEFISNNTNQAQLKDKLRNYR